MKIHEDVEQLRCLNSLLTLTTGSDPDVSDQIGHALDFQRKKTGSCEEDALGDPVQMLLNLHLKDKETAGFYHLELNDLHLGPLWVRVQLVRGLKNLTGYKEGVLLVTGLKDFICPPGKRWTQKRRGQYREMLDMIEQHVALWLVPRNLGKGVVSPSMQLNLLVL
tara:strand:- start:79120 stop:79614 length:495 start_codon:yes stop_codon:yes gene_type:complete